jgi:hypothetical protein
VRLPIGQSASIGRAFIDLFPESVAIIVRTIELGWEIARAHPEVVSTAGEVTMTECLRDGMREALKAHDLPWRKKMIVAPGTESRSQPGLTAPDGRTDIPIFLFPVFEELEEHDPHAIAECKRVCEYDATLAREYVVEGIDRFRTGKYSENHAHGFMIGYLISGTESGAVAKVNKYLEGQSRIGDMLSDNDGPVWKSTHSRAPSDLSISLNHIMLAI